MTASVHASEMLVTSVLLQLIVMIGVARLFNAIARALGQPDVIGEFVAGLMLGPSLFGHFCPGTAAIPLSPAASAPITVISQIGLVLLMFQIGSDFEFALLRSGRYRMATTWVALASIGAALLLGFGFGWTSAPGLAAGIDPLIYSLFSRSSAGSAWCSPSRSSARSCRSTSPAACCCRRCSRGRPGVARTRGRLIAAGIAHSGFRPRSIIARFGSRNGGSARRSPSVA